MTPCIVSERHPDPAKLPMLRDLRFAAATSTPGKPVGGLGKSYEVPTDLGVWTVYWPVETECTGNELPQRPRHGMAASAIQTNVWLWDGPQHNLLRGVLSDSYV